MTGRDTRVVAGVAALVIGIALIGSAVLDLGEDSRTSTTAQATPTASPPTSAPTPSPVRASTSPSATPSAPLSSSAATAPGPDSTPDPFTRVSAFTTVMVPAMRDADAATLAALLHPATIERYGLEACLEELGRINDPTFDIVVHGVGSPEPWDYTTDGVTTAIPDALDVDAAMTVNGATEATDLHLAIVDGEVRWFTDCGTPRP